MRVARLAWPIIFAVSLLAAPASAQGPAVHQYTAPAQGIESESTTGSSGGSGSNGATGSSGGSGSNGATGSSGVSGSSSAGTSGQSGTGASAGGGAGTPPPTLRLSFGRPDPALAPAIDAALLQGGMPPSLDGLVTAQRLKRFLDSKLADELGDG